jgi:ATP synthase F0 subunit c
VDLTGYTQLAAYLGAGLCMGLGAIGAAVGEGYTAQSASEAIARQPAVSGELLRTMLVGQAVAESASIFALVVAILLIFSPWPGSAPLQAVALFSAGLCMGAGALGPGAGAGLASAAACLGAARSPRASNKLLATMLIGQAVAQTPAIFALMISFLLLFTDYSRTAATIPTMALLLATGLSIGLGGLGPGIGSGIAAAGACQATARRPDRSQALLGTMLVGQAVSQTPSIFALLVAFLLFFHNAPTTPAYLPITAAFLGAGLCMGLGSVGPGVGSGIVAGKALAAIAKVPQHANLLTRTMLIGQAVSQSTSIYALVVVFVLLYVI